MLSATASNATLISKETLPAFGYVLAGLSGNRHLAMFDGVLALSMASFLNRQPPAILLKH